MLPRDLPMFRLLMRFAFCFTTVKAPKGWALDVPRCVIAKWERERERERYWSIMLPKWRGFSLGVFCAGGSSDQNNKSSDFGLMRNLIKPWSRAFERPPTLNQWQVLNAGSTKVLLYFFSHACPDARIKCVWWSPYTFWCCPDTFGSVNYTHFECLMNTPKILFLKFLWIISDENTHGFNKSLQCRCKV